MRRGSAISVALGLLGLLLAHVARADTMLAQAAWPPPRLAEPMTVVSGPRVTLQVDNLNARLQQHTPLRWQDVCVAPCGIPLDPQGLYRVGGGTSIASEPFQLPRSSGDVFVDAQVGSKVKHWVGLGLMIGGAAAALYGILEWQLFNSFASADNSGQFGNSVRDTGRTIGIVFISVGAVLEVVGITMFAGGTSVQVR